MENKISIDIPQEVVAQVNTHLQTAFNLLVPYSVTVGDKDKKSLLKAADATAPFLSKSQEYIGSAPEFAPKFFDEAEFTKDTGALSSVDTMHRNVGQVSSLLSDTRALLIHDAYSSSLSYYNAVKQAAKEGHSKAKVIYDDLNKRFPGKPQSVSKAAEKAKE